MRAPHPHALGQGARFLVTGVAQVAVDFLAFIAFLAAGFGVPSANVGGRIAGAAAGYLINGLWTFRREGERTVTRASLMRFIASWLLLTTVSTLAVAAATRAGADPRVAKIGVEAVMAILSFLLMRAWVYSSRKVHARVAR
jgi:putative flippase GtrA